MSKASRFKIRTSEHIKRNPRKYWCVVFGLIGLQMLWDISANDLAAYVQPVFTRLFGLPPAP